MFKINNKYTRTTQWSRSGVVIVNVEHIAPSYQVGSAKADSRDKADPQVLTVEGHFFSCLKRFTLPKYTLLRLNHL